MSMKMSEAGLKRVKRFAAALFAFTVPFSVTAVEAALFLMFCVLFIESRVGAENRAAPLRAASRQPLFTMWMLYLAAGLTAAVFAMDKGRAFAYLPSDLIKYLCFATLLSTLKDELLGTAAEFYTAGAVFAAAAGAAHVAWFFSSYDSFYQRAGAFSNPVRYGEILVIAFAFVLSSILRPPAGEGPSRTKFRLAALALLFVTVLLTRTRGAYLGLMLVPAAIFAFDGPSRRRLALWGGGMLLLGALAAAFNPYVRERIGNPYSQAAAAPAADGGRTLTVGNKNIVGVNIRLELWKTGAAMFRDHPLLGVGPANVKNAFRLYHPGPLGVQETWSSLHNLYLHQLAERGLTGLAALLALFGGMFALSLRNFRKERDAFTLWAVSLLPAFFVMNLTEISFQHVHTSFAVLMALAASTNSAARRDTGARL
ncbi:MAG TPA: O-antigen ligase family protein [Elusimicrobiales bacterium]|nr:O-antigen ligase family protein [Elusimicrobiales bacterium]